MNLFNLKSLIAASALSLALFGTAFAAEKVNINTADATQLALHFGRVARDHGATVRQNTPVARVLTAGDTVSGVELASGERVEADEVIVASGWWSKNLLAPLGIDFPCDAYRSELLVVDAGEPLRDLPVVSDLVSLQYCRVEGSGQFLVGNSDHDHAEDKFVDPDHYSNVARDTTIEKYADKIMHRFPGFPDPAVTHSYAGVYDVPPDWNPVIAPLKAVHGVTLAAGFAGHGFKMSPAVGDLVADRPAEVEGLPRLGAHAAVARENGMAHWQGVKLVKTETVLVGKRHDESAQVKVLFSPPGTAAVEHVNSFRWKRIS